jgi:hypothetical protein
MDPQGSSPINDAYFAAQEAQIAEIKVCSELQTQVNMIFASLQANLTAINAQLALLQPILALLEAPENPGAVITWISNFITNFLTPYVVPYTTLTTQLTELSTKIEELITSIENAAAEIEGCTITIPPLTGL